MYPNTGDAARVKAYLGSLNSSHSRLTVSAPTYHHSVAGRESRSCTDTSRRMDRASAAATSQFRHNPMFLDLRCRQLHALVRRRPECNQGAFVAIVAKSADAPRGRRTST